MGEFTQNLLKLTEFPFSYSLIGLLALISGQGINPEKLSFAQVGPLLILMGFVATTLSICDPVGAFQRWMLRRGARVPYLLTIAIIRVDNPLTKALKRLIRKGGERTSDYQVITDKFILGKDFMDAKIFGNSIGSQFPLPYVFTIGYSPEGIKFNPNIRWNLIHKFFNDTGGYVRSKKGESLPGMAAESPQSPGIRDYDKDIQEIAGDPKVAKLLDGLKQLTVKTKWITAEVDRITALIYFMTIISLFIVATLTVGDFLPKFPHFLSDMELTKFIIFILSMGGLIAVAYALGLRIKGLKEKASIVFKYLTALGAIKTEKEKFKATLDDIERYLNDNHWTLAEYWVDRIMVDYSNLFLEQVKNPTGVTKGPTGVR